MHPSAAYRVGVQVALEASGYDVIDPPTRSSGSEPHVTLVFVGEEEDWYDVDSAIENRETLVVALIAGLSIGRYRQALALGADGVCDADLSPELIAHVVDAAVAGEVVLPAAMARQLLSASSRREKPEALTEEEHNLLQRYADGASIGDLARDYYLGERTVRRRLQNACVKLGASSRAEAVKRATQLGLIG
jgi:two-component system response regulator DesR